MTAREVLTVKVFGEEVALPLTMEAAQRLEDAGLCAVTMTMEAALKGQRFLLRPTQAARVLAIGMGAKDVRGKARELWERGRREGASAILVPATEYLARIAADASPEADGPTLQREDGGGGKGLPDTSSGVAT